MNYKMIFQLLGGLGLFVYGMHIMGEGLQKAAGSKMKKLLEVLTKNTFLAVTIGALVTAIIQSSSATTVMTIGFVNAGLLNLAQAAGVIMGANIGTTMTAQLIAFKLSDVAPLILALGVCLVLFAKKKKLKEIGEIVLGFGVLFVGMSMMETSMIPLKELDSFKNLVLILGKHPFMGVIVGICMTAMVQSSSATIGILMALASAKSIDLAIALPILYGDNIGTCITALLASIGTNKNAKRASLIHLTFNVIGTFIFMCGFHLTLKLIPMLGGDVQRQIANSHTVFNILNVFIIAPFIPLLVKFANKMVPGKDKEVPTMHLEFLDIRFLETPSVALAQVLKEVVRMAEIAKDNLSNAVQGFLNNDIDKVKSVYENEKVINFLEREITDYIVKLSNTPLSQVQSEIVTSLFHVVNDIERIGDHADNIAELGNSKIENEFNFSAASINDINIMYAIVDEAINDSIICLRDVDIEKAKEILKLEKKIDKLEKDLKDKHIERLNARECSPDCGALFLDFLANMERIGDHSNNLAHITLDRVAHVKINSQSNTTSSKN